MWPRIPLPRLLGQQMGRRGLPAHGRVVPVLGGKLWHDDFKQPSFPAVVWSRRSIVNIADVITSVCGNIDGSISLMSRIRDVIMSSQQFDLKMQFLACFVCIYMFLCEILDVWVSATESFQSLPPMAISFLFLDPEVSKQGSSSYKRQVICYVT